MTNDLGGPEEVRALLKLKPHVFRRDAETSTQDACATQKGELNARQLTR